MNNSRKKTAVIGLGNILLGDEGLGLRVARILKRQMKAYKVDVIEGGTIGYSLIPYITEREKIIFIDCGFCNLNFGEYKRFFPEDVISQKKQQGLSLHEFDLPSFINFAKNNKLIPNTKIIIYCMQIKKIEIQRGLSKEIKDSLPSLMDDIKLELDYLKK